MKVLILKVILYIPYSKSLKDKRSVIKALKDKIWKRFRASISEIDSLDSHKEAVLGIVYTSNNSTLLEKIMNQIIDLIDDSYPGLIHDYNHIIEHY
ncbi:MAG: DUF503 domain-containing protein [Spirochaetota bacterium]|nr:MAG: DUF503 domain-containing protein [Spirochaetota bacterium]